MDRVIKALNPEIQVYRPRPLSLLALGMVVQDSTTTVFDTEVNHTGLAYPLHPMIDVGLWKPLEQPMCFRELALDTQWAGWSRL